MVLVDTSIWVRFLAGKEPIGVALDRLLSLDEVLGHDLVYGELLLGNRGARDELLAAYGGMSRAEPATHGEVVELVKTRRLAGRGIGWSDAHLLAAALIEGAMLWTADDALSSIARDLDVHYQPGTR